MTTQKAKVNQKIDAMARTAKTRAERVIDDIVGVANHAADKAAEHVHDAGQKVKEAGEKMMKLVD